jgi:adenylyltransferase/sulfurtransferase
MEEQKNQLHSEILSQKEIRRYTAQISNTQIGLTGQEKIKESKVLVIGIGGKGTSILQNLTTIGIGKLGICDNSFIEESDLSRQSLFGNNDLGKLKAIVAKQKLQEINHHINFEVHNVFIAEKNVEILCKNYDILIDATNNLDAHFLISDIALKVNKSLIFTSVTESTGQIFVFNYKNKSSIRNLSPKWSMNTNKETTKELLCQVSILSIIGALVATETLKLIMGIDTQLNSNLLKIKVNDYSFILEPISKES